MAVLINRKERITQLFNSKELSDCVFIIGNEKLKAHKLLLAISSPVFEKTFYGPLANNEVEITDIDLNIFELLLKFIYVNDVTIDSISTAWKLYYSSNKYSIKELGDKCLEYITDNLTLSTLLLSYEYAKWYELDNVADICWLEIISFAKYLFKIDYHVKACTLKSLIKEKNINASEHDLFYAIAKWSKEECILKGLSLTSDNIKKVLEDSKIVEHLWSVRNSFVSLNYDAKVVNTDKHLEQHVEEPFQLPYKSFRFRTTYKISCERQVHRSDKLNCTININRKLLLRGIALAPIYCKRDILHVDCVVSITNSSGALILKQKESYKNYVHNSDGQFLMNLKEYLVLEENSSYNITVEYASPFSQYLVLYYLADTIESKKNNVKVTFSNENVSTILGLSLFPIE